MNAMMRVAAFCAAFTAFTPHTASAQVEYYWWSEWSVQYPYVVEYYPPPVVYYAPPIYVPVCWTEQWWDGWCWQVRQVCQ